MSVPVILLSAILWTVGTDGSSAESTQPDEAVNTNRRPAHFAIQANDSEIRILAYRAGLLGGFGHNHVIASTSINGDVWLGVAAKQSKVEFAFPVTSLSVDDPHLRALEGDDFPGEISEKDIRATHKNMLGGELLDADSFADIHVKSVSVSGELPELAVRADVTILGQVHSILFPVTVSTDGNTLNAYGKTRLSHGELGLTPFKAAFGTLRVAEEMEVKYRIVAVKSEGG